MPAASHSKVLRHRGACLNASLCGGMQLSVFHNSVFHGHVEKILSAIRRQAFAGDGVQEIEVLNVRICEDLCFKGSFRSLDIVVQQ